MEPLSLYFHIPFCRHRCGYCDFNTTAGLERLIPAYTDAMLHEVRQVTDKAGMKLPVHSVFFGGGTPSLVSAADYEKLWALVRQWFELTPDLEATLEANPGTVTQGYLQDLRMLGFNRISFGMQSAKPEELRLLERQHTTQDVIDALRWARTAGFKNNSLDLILGLPGQSLPAWMETVKYAASLSIEHLSIYALTVEEGTPLYRWVNRGLVSEPDDDLAADMYEWTCGYLNSAGFEQYEISNWARKRDGILQTCQHNLQYWRNLPYLGFGAGAHGYAAGVRTENQRGVQAYIEACKLNGAGEFPIGPAAVKSVPIDLWTAIEEHLMVGLRLTQEGVSKSAFTKRFGCDLEAVFGPQIQSLLRSGLLEWAGSPPERLKLTTKGILLGNQVFVEFVGNPSPL